MVLSKYFYILGPHTRGTILPPPKYSASSLFQLFRYQRAIRHSSFDFPEFARLPPSTVQDRPRILLRNLHFSLTPWAACHALSGNAVKDFVSCRNPIVFDASRVLLATLSDAVSTHRGEKSPKYAARSPSRRCLSGQFELTVTVRQTYSQSFSQR